MISAFPTNDSHSPPEYQYPAKCTFPAVCWPHFSVNWLSTFGSEFSGRLCNAIAPGWCRPSVGIITSPALSQLSPFQSLSCEALVLGRLFTNRSRRSSVHQSPPTPTSRPLQRSFNYPGIPLEWDSLFHSCRWQRLAGWQWARNFSWAVKLAKIMPNKRTSKSLCKNGKRISKCGVQAPWHTQTEASERLDPIPLETDRWVHSSTPECLPQRRGGSLLPPII